MIRSVFRGLPGAFAAFLLPAVLLSAGVEPAASGKTSPANPLEALSEIEEILASHPADLGPAIHRDPNLRRRFFDGLRLLLKTCQGGGRDDALAERIYARTRAIVLAHPRTFRDDAKIDVFDQPHIATLRARLWMLLATAMPADASRRKEIADAMGLSGPGGGKRDLWVAHGLLLLDNNGFDRRQIEFLRSLAEALPPRSTENLFVTCKDLLEPPGTQSVLRKGHNSGVNYRLELQDGIPFFSFDREGGGSESLRDKERVASDTWTHVAVTFDGKRLRFYRDGAESASVEAKGVPIHSSWQPVVIGRDDAQGIRFRGELDEVRLWNRALAPGEIATEAQGGDSAFDAPAGSWRMDEADGEAILDDSGRGGHGGLKGLRRIAGKSGGALRFDGRDGAVTIPDSPDLRLGPQMTIAARFRIVDERLPMDGLLNLFSIPIGRTSGCPFPPDGGRGPVDDFCLSAIHMFHFAVCHRTFEENPARRAAFEGLMRRAGKEPMQYLRSMFVQPDGASVFHTDRAGILPSLSQQYFADTWRTLDLGLSRFDRGWKEPINQFLFFAVIHSRKGEEMKTFSLGAEGVLSTALAPIETDADGRIVRIRRGGRVYEFRLGKEGEVLSYRTEGFDLNATVRLRLEGASLRDALSVLRRTAGLRFLAEEDALRRASQITISEEAPLGRILEKIARQAGVSCETTPRGIVMFRSLPAAPPR